MIVARGEMATGLFLILGLSRNNVERLMAGRPIVMKNSTHKGIPEGWEISIFFGEDEQAMAQLLKKAGLMIPGETKTHIDPRLGFDEDAI
jgi:hypothetical protein